MNRFRNFNDSVEAGNMGEISGTSITPMETDKDKLKPISEKEVISGFLQKDAGKTTLKNHPGIKNERYKMNSACTLDHIRNQYDEKGREWFDTMMDSGVGGKDEWRAHLKGTGEKYFMTSDSEDMASGNFLTKDNPGDTGKERRENLQLPPQNDGSRVHEVISKKPAVVLVNKVAPQEEWAGKSDYEAKEGILQTFTPTLDRAGAIHAGVYDVQEEKEKAQKEESKK